MSRICLLAINIRYMFRSAPVYRRGGGFVVEEMEEICLIRIALIRYALSVVLLNYLLQYCRFDLSMCVLVEYRRTQ